MPVVITYEMAKTAFMIFSGISLAAVMWPSVKKGVGLEDNPKEKSVKKSVKVKPAKDIKKEEVDTSK